MTAMSERLELRLDENLLERVDNWRRIEADVPQRSEAIRRLLSKALSETTGRQFFQMARLQVMSSALQAGSDKKISDAYVFAWDNCVYPFFDDTAEFHKPFADFFHVSKAEMDEFTHFLCDRWDDGKVPSFANIEHYFKMLKSLDRTKLVKALRYIYLCGDKFDKVFWDTLLAPKFLASEAKTITLRFDRTADLRFL